MKNWLKTIGLFLMVLGMIGLLTVGLIYLSTIFPKVAGIIGLLVALVLGGFWLQDIYDDVKELKEEFDQRDKDENQ